MITEASKIIRKLAGPNATLFNDKLISCRSYKVWGWKISDYKNAKTVLENAGYTVTIKIHNGFSGRSNRYYQQPRLWVA